MVRRDRFPYTHSIKLEKLFPTSQIAGECISFGAAPNKAVVGANAFAHESGIHQHGMLANSADLRDHDAGLCRRGQYQSCAGQALRPRALADRLEKLGTR